MQPTFIGVFDTVASLRTAVVRALVWGTTLLAGLGVYAGVAWGWTWWVLGPLGLLLASLLFQLGTLLADNFKYFSDDPSRKLKLWRPSDWRQLWRTGHFAGWSKQNYDQWLDPDVQHARHAMAIDEDRADFLRKRGFSRSETAKIIQTVLAEEGRTMIIVTHDMDFARSVAHRALFLDAGKIEEEGPVAELFGNPRSPRLRQFISAGKHA